MSKTLVTDCVGDVMQNASEVIDKSGYVCIITQ